MIQIAAGINAEGFPFIRWRDGWDVLNDKFETEGRWTRKVIEDDHQVGNRIRRWYAAMNSCPKCLELVPEGITGPESLILIYQLAPLAQPPGFESDWIEIMKVIRELTGDADLEFLIDGSLKIFGQRESIRKQRDKEAAISAERSATSQAHAEERYKGIPSEDELKQVFFGQLDKLGYYPRSGGRHTDFWKRFQDLYEDSWPYPKRHDALPIKNIKGKCEIGRWTKEWKDVKDLIKR